MFLNDIAFIMVVTNAGFAEGFPLGLIVPARKQRAGSIICQ